MVEQLDKKNSIQFTLLGVPEPLNKMLRMPWRKRHEQTRYWYEYIFFETRKFKIKEPFHQARVSIVRYSPRTLDFDGLVGSCKSIVDGLIRARIIRDDNWDCVGPWCVDQVKQKQQKMTIEVTEK